MGRGARSRSKASETSKPCSSATFCDGSRLLFSTRTTSCSEVTESSLQSVGKGIDGAFVILLKWSSAASLNSRSQTRQMMVRGIRCGQRWQ